MSDREMIAELRNVAAAVGAMADVQRLHTHLLQMILTAATEVTPLDESGRVLERIATQLEALASRADILDPSAFKR